MCVCTGSPRICHSKLLTRPFKLSSRQRSADSLEHCFECSRECRDRASWKAGCDKWMSDFGSVEAQLLGWEASTYGELQPAVSLVQRVRSRLPVRFVTVVLTDERCSFELRDSDVVILRDKLHEKSSDVSEYRVSLSANAVTSSETDSFPVREFKA